MKMRNNPTQIRPSNVRRVRRFISLFTALFLFTGLGLRAEAQDGAAAPAPASSPAPAPSGPSGPVTEMATGPGESAGIAASMNSMDELNEKVKLGNGDRVSYRVVEEQKDPVFRTVSDSGELELPLVGRVTATGKTCKQLAFELKPLLEKQYFYHATVIIGVETFSTHPRGEVYLMGEVLRQGAIEIPANENLTVSKAILLVGGLGDFADRRKVKLVRKKPDGTSDTTIVDLVEILDKGHSERDPVVQADDMIIVPERLVKW